MNQSNAAQFLPLVQALADGKTIQYRVGKDKWEDLADHVAFVSDPSNFRIKPEKKIGWINVYKTSDGRLSTSSCVYATKDEAYKNAAFGLSIACIQITFEEGEGL